MFYVFTLTEIVVLFIAEQCSYLKKYHLSSASSSKETIDTSLFISPTEHQIPKVVCIFLPATVKTYKERESLLCSQEGQETETSDPGCPSCELGVCVPARSGSLLPEGMARIEVCLPNHVEESNLGVSPREHRAQLWYG